SYDCLMCIKCGGTTKADKICKSVRNHSALPEYNESFDSQVCEIKYTADKRFTVFLTRLTRSSGLLN
ncbi:hypothetical protein L9F63_014540, partial [Diploptera punctata]